MVDKNNVSLQRLKQKTVKRMKPRFFHRYLSSKVLPIWTILLIDVFIIVSSCMLSYALRYDFRSIFLDSSTIDKTILWTVIVNLVFFRVGQGNDYNDFHGS